MTISRHPELRAGPLPLQRARPTRDSSFHSEHPLTVSPVIVRPELGPRSLDPDRSFWSAFAELIRDQTSPTDFCNIQSTCEQPNPSSRVLAGTEASTSFLFNVPRTLPCGSGDTRRAALRPFAEPQCWFLPLAWVCPTVMPTRTPHHATDCSAECVVRIDVHGSLDRVKDASPDRMRRSLVLVAGACALWRMPTTFPSSAPSGHPLSSARLLVAEDTATR